MLRWLSPRHRLLMSELHERPPGMRLFDPRPFVLEMRRAVIAAQSDIGLGRFIRANGIDIHVIEAGAGEPLILLENGMISTNPIWTGWMSSYGRHHATLARHFRIIVPDFRGSGRTVHPGGPISYRLLADDVAALIDALHLDQPFLCGYGEGGLVATVVGIRKPAVARA